MRPSMLVAPTVVPMIVSVMAGAHALALAGAKASQEVSCCVLLMKHGTI